MFRIRTLTAMLFAVVFVTFLLVVLGALVAGKLDTLHGIGVVVLGGLSIASFFLAVGALDAGEGIAVESHWGGLGGGVSGVRLTLPLGFIIAALCFAGAAAVVVIRSAGAAGT